MKSKSNYPLLLGSQFFSAFGDNVILAVIVGQLTLLHAKGTLNDHQLRTENTIYTCLLFIPFILLAPIAGFLNDRFAKTRWLLGGNLIKLAGTAIAALSLSFGEDWQRIGYFVVGIGACVYSPAKYGVLPEILPPERLVKANGTMELLTLLAILAGPLTGAWLVDTQPIRLCFSITLLIYGLSLVLNLFMTRTPAHPGISFGASYGEFFHHFKELIFAPRLGRILMGTMAFWICGAVLKINFLPWGLTTLHLADNRAVAKLGIWLGIGITGGMLLAGQLHRVGDLRATRLYGIGLAVLIACLGLVENISWVGPVLILIGAAAGLFLIPLNASLQAESHQGKLGKTIATQNFVENIAMTCGGFYVFQSVKFEVSPSGVFYGLAIIIGTIAIFLKFSGSGHIAATGPAEPAKETAASESA
jgi:LPLT family lysophospholipid transporter-like MFS transporter